MKEKLDIDGDINLHLDEFHDGQGIFSCDKFVYTSRLTNSTDGMKPELKLIRKNNTANLQILPNVGIIKSNNFCVEEDDRDIISKACTMPCLGRTPCLR